MKFLHQLPKSIQLPLVIFLAAFSLHLIHIGFAAWGKDLLSPYAYSDEYLYLHRAWHMAFVDPSGGYLGTMLSVTPYARLLTWAYQLFGDGFWVPMLVNAILMSLVVMFVALLTRQLFDERTAWIAGFIGILCGPFIFFAGLTYKTNLVLLFLSGGLYFSIRYFKTRSLFLLFLASLLIIAASVERYQLILILIVLGAFVFWPLWKQRDFHLMLRPALVIGCSFIIVGFMSVGQGKHKVSTVVSPIGINVYIGYGPGAWGGYTPLKTVGNNILSQRLNTKTVAEKEAGKELSHLGVQWHWIRKIISYYSSVPQDLFILQFRKVGLLFAQATQGQPEEYRVWRWQRPALMIAFIDLGLVIALALFSFYHLRKKKNDISILFLFYSLLAYAFGVWIFYVQERYRMPIMLMLIPFAAFGVKHILSDKSKNNVIKNICVVILLYGFTFLLNQLNREGAGWSEDHIKTRNMQERRTDMEFKVYNFKKTALELNDEKSWLSLAVWFNRRGFYPDAISYAKNAILATPESIKGYELLIDAYTRTNNITALTDLKKTLEQSKLPNKNNHFKSVIHRIESFLRHENEKLKAIKEEERKNIRDIIRRR